MVLGARKAAQGAFVTSTAARDHDRFTLTLWIRVEAATELTYLVRGASRLRFANNTEGAAWISISQVNAQKRGRSLNAAAEWEVEGTRFARFALDLQPSFEYLALHQGTGPAIFR